MKGQSNAWIAGNNYVHFTTSGTVTEPLPAPGGPFGYGGQVAQHNQYIEYSIETGVLFFIIDSNVYNREGYLIADNSEANNCGVCLPVHEANVMAVHYPGHCDKFWIFFGRYASFLDLSAINPFQSSQRGRFHDWSDANSLVLPAELTPFAIDAQDEQLVNIEWFLGNQWFNEAPCLVLPTFQTAGQHLSGRTHIDVLDNSPNGAKTLFLVQQLRPSVFNVDAFGIQHITTWNNFAATLEDTNYAPVEVFEHTDGTITLAAGWSQGTLGPSIPLLYLWTADANYTLLSSNQIVPTFGGNGGICDLAFSPSGDYLYYGLENAPYAGYLELANLQTTDLSATLSLAEREIIGNSQLEINEYNGSPALYCASTGGLSVLTSPDAPVLSSFVTNAIPVSNMGQMTTTSPNSFNALYLLQHQAFNETYNLATQTLDCCSFFADQFGELSYKVEGSNTWSPGNTPFEEVSGVVYFEQDIVFASGSYTVINDLEFRFAPMVKAVIEAGAYVELNGCVWTAQCNEMWLGTQLLGTTNAQHSISQSSSNQGVFRLNNSTIEHARLAIAVGTSSLNSGGVVRAYNSKFRNNRRDVLFRPFKYITSGGNLVMNTSVFHDTYFITDAALNIPQILPSVHAELREVYGIRFEKCSFINSTPYSVHAYNQRGTGIFAVSAFFRLSGSNTEFDEVAENTDATSFYRLFFGIRSTGFSNPLATYLCRYQEFQECTYGIVNFQTDNIQVYENNFALMTFSPQSGLETMVRGIYLTGSTGYEVQQNYFTFDGTEAGVGLGVWVDHSGPDANQIRNNHFNRLKLGCYFTNENANPSRQEGLQALCNLFTSCTTDIYRGEKTSMRQDQGGLQDAGGDQLNAGNVFSEESPNCTGIAGDFRNHPNQDVYGTGDQWYVTYNCSSASANLVPFCEYPSNDRFGVTIAANFITSCASIYPEYSTGGPGPLPGAGLVRQDVLSELDEANGALSSLEAYYRSWVDDGTTASSATLVANAFPSESAFVRDIMLQRFPLSDQVLKRFIQNASSYDPWHLTQVFLANSPLNPRFLFELEQSAILSPFFMGLIHSAQDGSNPRHLVEKQLMGLATQIGDLRRQLGHDLLHNKFLDSTYAVHPDTLFSDLGTDPNSLQSATHSIFFGASTGGFNLPPFPVEIEEYEPLFVVLQTLRDSLPFDTLAISSAISNYETSDSPGLRSVALALQHAHFGQDSLPNPVLASDKTLEIYRQDFTDRSRLETRLAIYPNPASERFMLTYPAELSGLGHVVIYDLYGRELSTTLLDGNGVLEMSTSMLNNGTYIARIHCEEIVIGSLSIIIKK